MIKRKRRKDASAAVRCSSARHGLVRRLVMLRKPERSRRLSARYVHNVVVWPRLIFPLRRKFMPPNPMSTYSGTQAIVRASLIMKAMSTSPHRGARVVDVNASDRTSQIHRILSCLVSEGLVVRDDNGKRLSAGRAVASPRPARDQPLRSARNLRPCAHTIAAVTGDTVFLATRRGDDALR